MGEDGLVEAESECSGVGNLWGWGGKLLEQRGFLHAGCGESVEGGASEAAGAREDGGPGEAEARGAEKA